jgi:biotin carboxyl carrier protein
MPFLFWRSTWFGLPLSDSEMAGNFADAEHPRKAQHALSQVADRIVRGDPSVRRWYPDVIAMASNSNYEIRLTAAWVMGQDNTAKEFLHPLRNLLADPHPMVRHNAALSLVRFGDSSGREDILSMLRAHPLTAPQGGRLLQRLKPGDVVNIGTLVGRIQTGAQEIEIRSNVPGTLLRWLVESKNQVAEGAVLAEVSPGPEMVWEALRALSLVGRKEDVPLIEHFQYPREGMPEQIRLQALETLRRIRDRDAE